MALFLLDIVLVIIHSKFLNIKIKKHAINEFFSSYIKEYGVQYGSFDEKIRWIFLGNDLTFEQRWLNKLI